jgi:hypothetical protein
VPNDITTALSQFLNGAQAMPQASKVPTVVASVVGSASNVDTGETDLLTYAMPAGTLNGNGQSLRITVMGTVAANANTKTVKVYCGSQSLTLNAQTTAPNNVQWSGTFYVTRTAADTQVFERHQAQVGTTAQSCTLSSLTEDDGAAITIKVTGQSGTASNDITARRMTVEWLPAGASA